MRFEREARILASLDHVNIVPIYDAGLDGDFPYIVMKLVNGCSLGDRVRAGEMTEAQALGLVAQVAAGLGHAHARQILHRDVKPSNILEDDQGRVYLVDFGLSTAAFATSITDSDVVVGTLQYMAPERLSGESTVRSDLYSVGAVLHEMVLGCKCFNETDPRVLIWRIANEEPPLLACRPATVSEPCYQLLKSLLAKDPAARPASAEEVMGRIEHLIGTTTLSAVSAASVPPRRWPSPKTIPGRWPSGSAVSKTRCERSASSATSGSWRRTRCWSPTRGSSPAAVR